MKKVLGFIFSTMAALIYTCLGLIGAGVHLWTALIAFSEGGFVKALIVFCLPVLSQIYYFFYSIGLADTLFNTYSIAIMAYLFAWVVVFVMAAIASTLDED
jgi:hypothetical protein